MGICNNLLEHCYLEQSFSDRINRIDWIKRLLLEQPTMSTVNVSYHVNHHINIHSGLLVILTIWIKFVIGFKFCPLSLV
jgi:hypothetical protein